MPNLSTLYVEFLASKKFHAFSISRWVSCFYFIYTKLASSKLSYLKIAKISADEYFFVLGKSVLILPYLQDEKIHGIKFKNRAQIGQICGLNY